MARRHQMNVPRKNRDWSGIVVPQSSAATGVVTRATFDPAGATSNEVTIARIVGDFLVSTVSGADVGNVAFGIAVVPTTGPTSAALLVDPAETPDLDGGFWLYQRTYYMIGSNDYVGQHRTQSVLDVKVMRKIRSDQRLMFVWSEGAALTSGYRFGMRARLLILK